MPFISTLGAYSAKGFGFGLSNGLLFGGYAMIGSWNVTSQLVSSEWQNYINGVDIDSSGNIYYSFYAGAVFPNQIQIVKCNSNGELLQHTFWYNESGAGSKGLGLITVYGDDLAISSGTITVSGVGQSLGFAGLSSSTPSGMASLGSGIGVTVESIGSDLNNLWFGSESRLVKYSSTGQHYQFGMPSGVKLGTKIIPIGTDVLVSTESSGVFHNNGTSGLSNFTIRRLSSANASVYNPFEVDVDSSGNIYVLSCKWHGIMQGQQPLTGYGSPVVTKFNSSGEYQWTKEFYINNIISDNSPNKGQPYTWMNNLSVNSDGEIIFSFKGVDVGDSNQYTYFMFLTNDGSLRFVNRLRIYDVLTGNGSGDVTNLTLTDSTLLLSYTKDPNLGIMTLPSFGQIPIPGNYEVDGNMFEYSRIYPTVPTETTQFLESSARVNFTSIGTLTFTGTTYYGEGDNSSYANVNTE